MCKKRIIILAFFLIVIISTAVILDGFAKKSFDKKYANLAYSSALLDIVGELRYTAAAILWVKADIYHHELEFRGLDTVQNTDIMPLFRMITLLDPHFIQAYDTGAYSLVVNLNRVKEGLDFLKEGIRNNPDSFELSWEYGFLMFYEKDYAEALPYLIKAHDNRDNALTSVYDEHMKIVWVNTRIVKCYEELGKPEKAEPYRKELEEYRKEYKKYREESKKELDDEAAKGAHEADFSQMKKKSRHVHDESNHNH